MMANQKGFTLIELLVSFAITGILVGVLVPFIIYLTRDTEVITDNTTAVLQVQAAGRSISGDVKMAADTIPADAAAGTLDNLTLLWTSRYQDTNMEHTIQYYLSGENLMRNYDGAISTVARYISDVEFSRSDLTSHGVITVVITATIDGTEDQTEKGTYRVTLRH